VVRRVTSSYRESYTQALSASYTYVPGACNHISPVCVYVNGCVCVYRNRHGGWFLLEKLQSSLATMLVAPRRDSRGHDCPPNTFVWKRTQNYATDQAVFRLVAGNTYAFRDPLLVNLKRSWKQAKNGAPTHRPSTFLPHTTFPALQVVASE